MKFTMVLLSRNGYVGLHKAGCRDIARGIRSRDIQNTWPVEAADAKAAVAYQLADFADQDMNVSESDITVYPCCRG